MNGKRVYTDGPRNVGVVLIGQSVHADGFLMVHLAAEKLLIQADAYAPAAPNTPPPAVPNGNHLNPSSSIEALKLNIERILPLHGRMVPFGDL